MKACTSYPNCFVYTVVRTLSPVTMSIYSVTYFKKAGGSSAWKLERKKKGNSSLIDKDKLQQYVLVTY